MLPKRARSDSTQYSRTRTTINALPDEVLQRILEHAVGTRTAAGGLRRRQWISAADLTRAAPLAAVCKRWCTALRAVVTRFTFFALPAATGHSARALHALEALPHLRALQLFVRPAEAATFAVALQAFLARTDCCVHTVHLCMPPHRDRSCAAERAVRAVVSATAAGAGARLRVLSLDSCGALAPSVLADVASQAPQLATLAFDHTMLSHWSALRAFPYLAELSFRNCQLNDDALRTALIATPHLETLALGYCEHLTACALRALAECRHLRSVELARCAAIRDDGVLALGDISSLNAVALLHIDVSADALVQLAQTMGPRLRSLCVTSVRTAATSNGATAVQIVTKAARVHCPNLAALEFAQRRSPHWSERAYAEAIRFAPQNYITGPRSHPTPPTMVKGVRRRQVRWTRFLKALFPPRRSRRRGVPR